MNYRARLAALERARAPAPLYRPGGVSDEVWPLLVAEIAHRLAGRPRRAAALRDAVADMNQRRPDWLLDTWDPILRAYMHVTAPRFGKRRPKSASAGLVSPGPCLGHDYAQSPDP
jgi:hypothetical protein